MFLYEAVIRMANHISVRTPMRLKDATAHNIRINLNIDMRANDITNLSFLITSTNIKLNA